MVWAYDTRGSQGLGTAGAYTFFAVMYFVQSVGDPTSGLIAQPTRSLLRSWGESPASLAGLMALLAIPSLVKPAFGLLSDFVPLLDPIVPGHGPIRMQPRRFPCAFISKVELQVSHLFPEFRVLDIVKRHVVCHLFAPSFED